MLSSCFTFSFFDDVQAIKEQIIREKITLFIIILQLMIDEWYHACLP